MNKIVIPRLPVLEGHSCKELGDKRITVSIGVTEFRNYDLCVEDVIKRADDALYRAKKNGKNRVECHREAKRDEQ